MMLKYSVLYSNSVYWAFHPLTNVTHTIMFQGEKTKPHWHYTYTSMEKCLDACKFNDELYYSNIKYLKQKSWVSNQQVNSSIDLNFL